MSLRSYYYQRRDLERIGTIEDAQTIIAWAGRGSSLNFLAIAGGKIKA